MFVYNCRCCQGTIAVYKLTTIILFYLGVKSHILVVPDLLKIGCDNIKAKYTRSNLRCLNIYIRKNIVFGFHAPYFHILNKCKYI